MEFEGIFPDPEAGQFWGFRWYTMNGVDQEQGFQHPFTLWPVGRIEMVTQAFSTYYWNRQTHSGERLSGGDWSLAAAMGLHQLGVEANFHGS